MNVKRVDNQEYLGMLKNLIEDGHKVSLLVSGSSMAPFICHERDSVILGPIDRSLKIGDIVFFQRENHDYILHRICKANSNGTYDIVGDNQTLIEKEVKRAQIFAIVLMVKRKGKEIKPGDFWWFFFEKIWIRIIPLRKFMIRMYALVR